MLSRPTSRETSLQAQFLKVCADMISLLNFVSDPALTFSVSNSPFGGASECERRKRPQARTGHLVGGRSSAEAESVLHTDAQTPQ